MRYVAHKRFRGLCLAGNVNVPYGSTCELKGNVIYKGDRPLVAATSENAHQYFARDDDGRGLERGKLSQQILNLLAPKEHATKTENIKRQKAWERIWDDPKLQPYRMREHADHWLWNHAFFNADIGTLNYIINLIKGGNSCTE